MNNKANPARYSRLSIVSLITGALTYPIGFYLFCWSMGDRYGEQLKIFRILTNIFIPLYLICLPITAIVCGSIDLIRIRTGRSSNNSKILDIVGIVLGSILITIIIIVYTYLLLAGLLIIG